MPYLNAVGQAEEDGDVLSHPGRVTFDDIISLSCNTQCTSIYDGRIIDLISSITFCFFFFLWMPVYFVANFEFVPVCPL